jgi:hypothetical protein
MRCGFVCDAQPAIEHVFGTLRFGREGTGTHSEYAEMDAGASEDHFGDDLNDLRFNVAARNGTLIIADSDGCAHPATRAVPFALPATAAAVIEREKAGRDVPHPPTVALSMGTRMWQFGVPRAHRIGVYHKLATHLHAPPAHVGGGDDEPSNSAAAALPARLPTKLAPACSVCGAANSVGRCYLCLSPARVRPPRLHALDRGRAHSRVHPLRAD